MADVDFSAHCTHTARMEDKRENLARENWRKKGEFQIKLKMYEKIKSLEKMSAFFPFACFLLLLVLCVRNAENRGKSQINVQKDCRNTGGWACDNMSVVCAFVNATNLCTLAVTNDFRSRITFSL